MSSNASRGDYLSFSKIGKYCNNLGKYNSNISYNQMANQQSSCSGSSSSSSRVANGSSIIPLSKTKTGLNSSTNTTAISCRMKYSQNINTYGIIFFI